MMRRACPRCNSTKVVMYAGGMTGTYRCMDCDYIGPMTIETEFNRRTLNPHTGKKGCQDN
ncbi:hypothetical protein J4425_00195 [Candidatus Woesearchaeota archaeon]|nr:hypothetical protein [Candidatus Woesearchaeota archaeon]